MPVERSTVPFRIVGPYGDLIRTAYTLRYANRIMAGMLGEMLGPLSIVDKMGNQVGWGYEFLPRRPLTDEECPF